MADNFREHYSQNFHMKIDRLPAQKTDCFSRLILFLAFIFGTLFLMLGGFLINDIGLSGLSDFERQISKTAIRVHTLIPTNVFILIMIALGFGLIFSSLFYLLRTKKIIFDGEKISTKDRPLIGKPHSFTEPLSNYTGVRLRLKLSQQGLINRNKFIIELYHEDPEKIVPLYISTNPKHIRTIWREYAVKLNLPPIHISEKGMVSHNARDMNRSYIDVVKSWNLPKNFIANKKHSDAFVCKQKQDKKLIKTTHVIFDLYSSLNILAILLFSILLGYSFMNHNILVGYLSLNITLGFYALLLTLIVYAFLSLIIKDVMLVHDKHIIIFRKIFNFNFKEAAVSFDELKGIDIFFTPSTGRYALQITTKKQTIFVFNKLSAEDLRWIRGFLICEIME